MYLAILAQQSLDLEEFCTTYREIEDDIEALRRAIEKFDEVVDGFVKVLSEEQGKQEWSEMVEREIEEMRGVFGWDV